MKSNTATGLELMLDLCSYGYTPHRVLSADNETSAPVLILHHAKDNTYTAVDFLDGAEVETLVIRDPRGVPRLYKLRYGNGHEFMYDQHLNEVTPEDLDPPWIHPSLTAAERNV